MVHKCFLFVTCARIGHAACAVEFELSMFATVMPMPGDTDERKKERNSLTEAKVSWKSVSVLNNRLRFI